MKYRGFSLLEMMLALAIASIFMALLQNPVISFHQMVIEQKQTSGIKGDLQRFLILLKTELMQSGYGFVTNGASGAAISITENSITLKADYNLDGDTLDKSESISYRYYPGTKTLKRQAGQGYYQKFIEGVELLRFASAPLSSTTVGSPKTCVEVSIQASANSKLEQTTLCPFDL